MRAARSHGCSGDHRGRDRGFAQRGGVFERAAGGTLLVDEIGDLPYELQSKLLRAIERSEITRVDGDCSLRVEVSVLDEHRGDVTRAAAAAGVARRHLQRLKSR